MFRETQTFRSVLWIQMLLLFVTATMLWGLWISIEAGEPIALYIMWPVTVGVVIGLVWFEFLALHVEVREKEIFIHMKSLKKRKVSYEDIVSAEAKQYRPIMEWGGWGIRWMPGKGVAYNVSGNQGVELKLTDGKLLLIGTRRPDELHAAITAAMTGRPEQE